LRQFCVVKSIAYLGLAAALWAACSPSAPEEQTQKTETPLDSVSAYLESNPNDLDALAFRSGLYLEQKNLPYAKADMEAALALDSNHVPSLLRKGEVYFIGNQTRTSKEAWERCIQLDPDNIPCRLKMAELYSIVQDYDKCLTFVDAVLKRDENNAMAYYIKGLALRDTKSDTALALKYIQKSIDLNPTFVPALDMAGVLHMGLNSGLAGGYFQRIIDQDPNNAKAYYNLGMFHLGSKDYNPAIAAFTTCGQLNPNDPEPFFNLGFIHLELSMLAEARVYFGQSIKAQEINYRAYYGRAFAAERGGDLTNAEKDYRKAVEYNPAHSPSKEGLMRILQEKSRM
jgi:tetratricopeptide (TPR) repeat protein